MYLFGPLSQDVVAPMALDRRLPLDTLFMVFEEDYRFFPDGGDIDGCDNYKVRMVRMLLERKSKGLHVQESLPLLDSGRTEDQDTGKGSGKVRPESRFHATMSRGSSDPTDEVNDGVLFELGGSGAVGHRGASGQDRAKMQRWRSRRGLQLRKFPAQERLSVEQMQRKVHHRVDGYEHTCNRLAAPLMRYPAKREW